jgi:hypothetical protein
MYVARKYVRRHRLAVASLCLVVAACLVSAVLILKYAENAREA